MKVKAELISVYGATEDEVEYRIHHFLDQPGIESCGVEWHRENDHSFVAVVYYHKVPVDRIVMFYKAD